MDEKPLLLKSELPQLERKSAMVHVPSFRGSIEVRALSLRDRLALAADKDADGPRRLCNVLHLCVKDASGQECYTIDEWEQFASRHLDDAMMLWDIARRLSGMDEPTEDDEKNDLPQS